MIQPTELRIGNLVLMDGELYHIRAGEQIDDFCDRMNPIPLTPEWLERCGFAAGEKEDDGPDDVWIPYRLGNIVIPYFISMPEQSHSVMLHQEDDTKVHIAEVSYLHQLQNWAYCLTGKELTIKL